MSQKITGNHCLLIQFSVSVAYSEGGNYIHLSTYNLSVPVCLKSLDMTGELVGITNIEKQKLAIKSLMSRLFFSPSVIGIGRGADSIIPDKHQLIMRTYWERLGLVIT